MSAAYCTECGRFLNVHPNGKCGECLYGGTLIAFPQGASTTEELHRVKAFVGPDTIVPETITMASPGESQLSKARAQEVREAALRAELEPVLGKFAGGAGGLDAGSLNRVSPAGPDAELQRGGEPNKALDAEIEAAQRNAADMARLNEQLQTKPEDALAGMMRAREELVAANAPKASEADVAAAVERRDPGLDAAAAGETGAPGVVAHVPAAVASADPGAQQGAVAGTKDARREARNTRRRARRAEEKAEDDKG
jgi:hypothetical protein